MSKSLRRTRKTARIVAANLRKKGLSATVKRLEDNNPHKYKWVVYSYRK